ncbi:trypsin-like serine protease [Corynebacterium oculi]|uniref:Trypsin n=1 Tax=Corynebacterium oculi TaxID=1544416 RepID=A0A0Q0UBB6_9CORY|nr:trypsin-like serine protease [Corynebacterium oculi]KQB83515.1 Trypsin [Corynebacterium oculi]
MKITRSLLGVALALTAFAPAAHASTTIQQGAAIHATEGYMCTLSIVDEHTAYTALHCGEGTWSVGDTIYSLHTGKALGTITGLGSDLSLPLDVVQIALNPDVQVTGHVGRGDSAALRNGDYAQFRSSDNYSTGIITEATPRRIILSDNKYPSILINSNVVTYAGNSGGPLMDRDGNVVGVLAAGNQQDDSLFTPLHLIEREFGEE